MESGDIYKANASLRGSLRSGSSSVWRNTGVDVFSRSSRDEDDEEALKWAALEKLPTVARLRKGILASSQGGANEIDVFDIGWQQRRALLERLVKVAEDDNEKFLLKLKNRIDRVGIDLPTIEVRFQNVNIEAQAFVGTNALPTVVNFMTNIFENLFIEMGILSSRKKKLTILKDVSGIIKPGRMTLLLGPPSSGKTTLLLALAGKLDTALKCSGTVTYNGYEMDEFVPQRTAAYISQHDLHIGEMTVRETLAFSARCQGVGDRYDMLAELSRREKQANIKPDPDIDVFMKVTSRKDQLQYWARRDQPYRLLRQYFVLVLANQMSSGLFRFIAATGRNMIVANTFGSFALLVLFALGGFVLARGDIKSWWIWVNAETRKMFIEEVMELVELKPLRQALGIQGVSKIKDGYNPATWMLEVTTSAQELSLGVDFTDIYKNSDLYRRNKALIEDLSKPAPGAKELYFPTHLLLLLKEQSFIEKELLECILPCHMPFHKS
ncbi:hypothetical protein V6N13_104915 [Hibiscus sabdariffa]